MTLQNPKPSDDAALRNFSLDYARVSTTPVMPNMPVRAYHELSPQYPIDCT